MKKTLISLLVMTISVLALAPFLMGIAAESRMAQRAEVLSDNPFMRIQVVDFERGWFDSRARMEFSLGEDYKNRLHAIMIDAQADEGTLDEGVLEILDTMVVMDVELVHGPILINDGLSLGFADAVLRLDAGDGTVKALTDEAGVADILKIRAQTGLDGVTRFTGGVPAMELTDEGNRIRFSGLNLNGSIDWRDRYYTLRGIAVSTELTGPGGALSIENFFVEADQRQLASNVWLGDASFGLERLSGSIDLPEGTEALEIADIGIRTNVKPGGNSDTVDIGVTYSVGAVLVPERVDLKNAVVGISFTGVDVESLTAVYTLNQRLVIADDDIWAELMLKFREVAYEFLSKSPGMMVDPVAFVWNGERFEASLHLSTVNDGLPPKAQFDLMDIAMWNQLLAAKADLDVSRKLAEAVAADALRRQLTAGAQQGMQISPEEIEMMSLQQAPVLLETFVQQGLIDRTPSGYTSSLSYRGGTLEVNSRLIPLPQLQ